MYLNSFVNDKVKIIRIIAKISYLFNFKVK